jgi:hypothetical protein
MSIDLVLLGSRAGEVYSRTPGAVTANLRGAGRMKQGS